MSTAPSGSPPAWLRAPGLWWCKHRDADPEDEDDGQQTTPQANKERRKGRSRRSERSGAQPPARTPTAHSTGPVKVHGDPDRFSSPGGGCSSRRSLRGHRTVEEPDAVAGASGFTI